MLLQPIIRTLRIQIYYTNIYTNFNTIKQAEVKSSQVAQPKSTVCSCLFDGLHIQTVDNIIFFAITYKIYSNLYAHSVLSLIFTLVLSVSTHT